MASVLTVLCFLSGAIFSATSPDWAQDSQGGDSTITVLVFPAYDLIANAGVSPDTQEILEELLSNKANLKVIPFPYRKLMGVPYQMVYDKKYCKAILEKVPCDVVVMSQIITKNERKPGIWPWSYKVRVYNVHTGKQKDSIRADNIQSEEFHSDMNSKSAELVADIWSTFEE